MSRIILTTIGSFGDLHPKIAIALELRKRSHDAPIGRVVEDILVLVVCTLQGELEGQILSRF